MYSVEKLKIRDEEVKITVSDEDSETVFCLSLNQFLDFNVREEGQISDEVYQKLSDCHTYYFCYKKAVKKLENADHSEKEICDLLKKVEGLKQDQLDDIIDKLKSYGYLDDRSLAIHHYETDYLRLIGKKKTTYDLKSRGVDGNIIEDAMIYCLDEKQYEAARKKSQQFLKRASGYSNRELQSRLKNHLYSAGFENEIISQVINETDFDSDETEEIRKQYEKAVRQYSRKYRGKALQQKVFQYLYNKGFESYNINIVMKEMESDYED